MGWNYGIIHILIIIMATVTQRIKQIKQPYGGYLRPSEFTKIEFSDGKALGEESIHSSLVGMAVDYLARAMSGAPLDEAFKISILGARIAGEERKVYKLLRLVKGLDNKSIHAACKIVGYDVCYRAGPFGFRGVDQIKADNSTIENIRIMVLRSLSFFEQYGPITKDSFTFEGGYTNIIHAGDGDFLTIDTLWDFKVSRKDPTSRQTLQLLVYYIMGQHSVHDEFDHIENLGIFNPRQNCAYIKEVKSIPDWIMNEVTSDVIGYGKNYISDMPRQRDHLLSMAEIMQRLSCSRYMVMKYYAENNLPLSKVKNRYMISEEDLATWLAAIEAARRREEITSLIIGVILLAFLVALLIYLLPLIQGLPSTN